MKNILILFTCLLALNLNAANRKKKDLLNISYGDHSQNTLDLYLPESYNDRTPVIIMLHGGAWMLGGKYYTERSSKILRDRGFVVANIDYRYVNDSVHCADLLKDIDNAIAKVQLLAIEHHFKKEGYHMAGVSAGGHLALLYGHTTKRKIRSVTSVSAPSRFDTPEIMEQLKRIKVLPNVQYLADAAFTTDGTIPEAFKNVSPYANVTNVPSLLIHGTKDDLVPFEHSTFLIEVLKKKGVPCKLLTMEGKGHNGGINESDTEQLVHDEITNWIKKYD